MRKELRALFAAVIFVAPLASPSRAPALPRHESMDQNEPKTQKQLIREVHHVLVMFARHYLRLSTTSRTTSKATR